MQESFAPEHSSELFTNPLEELLDGSRVSNKCGGHLETTGRDVADSGLDVVGDPFYKVAGVLVLDAKHLLVNLLHGHPASEDGGDGEVPSMPRVTGGHHVLGVKHLLGKLGNSQGSVLLRASGSEWSKARHEEVKPGEGDHVHGQLPQVSVELPREPERGGDSRHGKGDQVVQVSIGGVGQLQGAEADVVQSLIINAISFVCVLHELVHREGGIVGLHDSVRDLGTGYNRVAVHDSVGIFLADLRDEKGTHARASAATQRVGELEALKTVAAFGLFPHNIEDAVNKLGTLGVVALGPVVTSPTLAKHEVVGPEELAIGA